MSTDPDEWAEERNEMHIELCAGGHPSYPDNSIGCDEAQEISPALYWEVQR